MGVLIASAVCNIIANILQCIPLSAAWDLNDHGKHCFDQNAYWRWGSFPNILTDVVMLGLPIPAISKLRLSWKDKIGLLLTFLAGGM